MSVSLCLIVKNEKRNLKNCLFSFRRLADEIIVVDTGSTDNTKQIAHDLGASVYDFKWCDDFSTARNFAIRQAAKDWVMVVDADDLIEPRSIQKIKHTLNQAGSKTAVISLPYIYGQTENNSGQMAWLPRLWRRSLNLKYVYPIHEYLDFSGVDPGQIMKLEAPVLHQKKDYLPGLKRNIKILVPANRKSPKDLRILYYLVHDNRHLGKFKEALKWCEKYFAANPQDPVHLHKVFMMQGICHLELDQTELARVSFLLAIGVSPLLIDPYLELGDLYYREGRYKEAIHMYHMAESCEIPKDHNAFFNQAVYAYFAERKLAYILEMVGNHKEALEYAQKVLKSTPNDAKLKRHIKKLKKANV